MDSIKDQLLKECKEFFDSISNAGSDDRYGTPPKVFYIDFAYGNKKKLEVYITDPQETYRYENGIVETVETGSRNKIDPVSGMYFPEGHGSIGIDKENGIAFMNFQVGPRYGRGFQYKIINTEEGMRLGEREMIWVS